MKKYQRFEESLNEAYWISPRGKIIKVETTHIDIIIDHPDYFGYSLQDIKNIYDRYNEELGSEGQAREQILLNLFKHGWIRIRKYSRPDKWSVNVFQLNHKEKDYIRSWSLLMLKNKHSKFDDVILDLNYGRKQYSLEQLSNDILYLEESITPSNIRLNIKFKKLI